MALPEVQRNFHGNILLFNKSVYSFDNQFFLGES